MNDLWWAVALWALTYLRFNKEVAGWIWKVDELSSHRSSCHIWLRKCSHSSRPLLRCTCQAEFVRSEVPYLKVFHIFLCLCLIYLVSVWYKVLWTAWIIYIPATMNCICTKAYVELLFKAGSNFCSSLWVLSSIDHPIFFFFIHILYFGNIFVFL